jgi:hypothetical protein
MEVEGIQSVEITATLGAPIRQLPDADGYLGFIFAKGDHPRDVETALRRAHDALAIRIRG